MATIAAIITAIQSVDASLSLCDRILSAIQDKRESARLLESLQGRIRRFRSSLGVYLLIPSASSSIPQKAFDHITSDFSDVVQLLSELEREVRSRVAWIIYLLAPPRTRERLDAISMILTVLERSLDTYGILIEMRDSSSEHARKILDALETYKANADGRFDVLEAQMKVLISSPFSAADDFNSHRAPLPVKVGMSVRENDSIDGSEEEIVESMLELPTQTNMLLERLAQCGAPEEVKKAVLRSVGDLLLGWRIERQHITFESVSDVRGAVPTEREVLGEGATSTVYAASMQFHDENGIKAGRPRPVAVKVFRASTTESSQFKADLLREVYLQRNLVHPCVLRTYGMYWPDSDQQGHYYNNQPFIVMEKMTHSLKDYHSLQALNDDNNRIKIVRDIANALDYLHSRNIVHRDVKPANVLLRVRGNKIAGPAKLCDFGVSRKVYIHTQLSTAAGESQFAGTIQFTPPEVLCDLTKCKTRKSWDIWSLGVLICYIYGTEPPQELALLSRDRAQTAARDGLLVQWVHKWKDSIANDTLRNVAAACLTAESSLRSSIADILHLLRTDVPRETRSPIDGQRMGTEDIPTGCERARPLAAPPVETDRFYLAGKQAEYGIDVALSVPDAVQFYEKGNIEGSWRCSRSLAAWMLEGQFGDDRRTRLFDFLQAAEASGDIIALFYIAYCYLTGKGCIRDNEAATEKADEFMRRSTDILSQYDADSSLTEPEKFERDELIFCRAECLRLGLGIDTDFSEALELFRKVGGRGHVRAQVRKAYCYICGAAGEEQINVGKIIYESAARSGDVLAQRLLGMCYRDGTVGKVDLEKAVEMLALAALSGDLIAQDGLNSIYIEFKNSRRGASVQTWLEASNIQTMSTFFAAPREMHENDMSVARAQLKLGEYYEHATGVERDVSRAAFMYAMAANLGIAHAQTRLSSCFEHGLGIRRNEKFAFTGYQFAMKNGDRSAEKCIATCQMFGIGVQANAEQAFTAYVKFAESGDMQARRAVGLCYERGIGTGEDKELARSAYRPVGASEPDLIAQRHLGKCLILGIGGDKNKELGFKMLLGAAKGGNLVAMRSVGACYHHGVYVDKNFKKSGPMVQERRRDGR